MTNQFQMKPTENISPQSTAAAPAVRKDSATILSIIERVAISPDVDIDKLERILEMQERIVRGEREVEMRDDRRAFFADLARAQREIPVVVKNRKNTFNNSTFADLAAIESAAMPVIRDHGFSVSAKSIPGAENGMQRVLFRVAHASGHVDETEDDFPLDSAGSGGKNNKTAIQAKGSTVTYARRYMLCAYFNIAIADDDGQPQKQAKAAELSASQAKEIYALIEETGTDEAKILKAARAASVEAIAPARFDALRARLIQKRNDAAANTHNGMETKPEETK